MGFFRETTHRPYRNLDPARILETSRTLAIRIEERFPGSGLAALSRELAEIASNTVRQVELANRPAIGLRIAAWILIGLGLAIVIELGGHLQTNWELGNPGEFIQSFQAAIESSVFLGAAIIFLLSWENRIKRRRILQYLHELRTIAHLVDMHQLPKTPDTIRFEAEATFTAHSPVRVMTPFQLARYFSYCSEMLSIIGKLATLYVQNFPDPAVLQAVDQIEDLTTGLSSKIWQKSMSLTPPTSPSIASSQLSENSDKTSKTAPESSNLSRDNS